MKQETADVYFMKETLALAEMARGWTGPDPMVAALVVKQGKILSRGYHDTFTKPHAETYALQKIGERAKGGTLYVNLEPCCHWGNNPPCTQNIIHSGIKRVVFAMKDPNPLVAGKGYKELRQAGIEVKVGILKEEALRLNEVFVKYIMTGRPFVTLKVAMTLDGKIATDEGKSRWITSERARRYGWQLRAQSDAILVGSQTILKDNPNLTCHGLKVEKPSLSSAHPEYFRTKKILAKDPLRVVLDSRGRVPLSAKVFDDSEHAVLVTTRKASKGHLDTFRKKGVQVWVLPLKGGRVDLPRLMGELGKRQVASLLMEGGGSLNASAFRAGIVDKVCFFYAPKILGGEKAPTGVEGIRSWKLHQALTLQRVAWTDLHPDFLLTGYLR